MNITNAKYIEEDGQVVSINAIIDGVEVGVPISAGNRHYDEIMKQVEAGDLTIADAD